MDRSKLIKTIASELLGVVPIHIGPFVSNAEARRVGHGDNEKRFKIAESVADAIIELDQSPQPSQVNIISFDEFIQYGKTCTNDLVNNMPWHFWYKGHLVTHENDKCYIVPTPTGLEEFTPKHVLHLDVDGNLYPHEIYVEPDQVKEEDKGEVIKYLQMVISDLDVNKNEAKDRGDYITARRWLLKRNQFERVVRMLQTKNK